MRGAGRLDRLHTNEAADAVVGVNDDVAGRQRRHFGDEVGATFALLRAAHQPVAENVLLGDEGERVRLETGLKRKHGEAVCGQGPIIARGPNINPVLFDLLVKAAEKAGVPYQIGAEPRGTGTDANAIQVCRGGKVAGLISIPLRYMHTPTEVLSLEDLESAVQLLARFVLDLAPATSFIP